jgi:ribonuclease HII
MGGGGRRRSGGQASLALDPPGPILGEGEAWAASRGYGCVVGVDEVGRGPLAGPVVAAAVFLPPGLGERLVEGGLDDSKRLTPQRREALAEWIRAEAVVGVGEVDAGRIDEINILRASFEAMGIAVRALCEDGDGTDPDLLLIDGNARITPHPLPRVRQHTLVQGDRRAVCIAAASVVAKVHRDARMVAYDAIHPGYGFAAHKGYGAPTHWEALERLGPSPIHRLSFRGVVKGEEA